ncbi:MAB_1171c family putative transporter [Streptomyces sp. NPDC087917]|uniref:MAB_1171c family putative transporter n=1 Tax=Streptomyces sp. NPDC087917 TaxID=3155060 RepID=UPI0034122B8B
MSNGEGLYLAAAVLVLALLLKAPVLRRSWDQPIMRSVCALLGVGCVLTVLAAPPSIAAVNRITGVVNFAAPLVYSTLTAFSGASIVLILHWSGGPAASVRRATRLTVVVFGALSVLIVFLFARGDAPVERLRDLDTYYANTPWLREMIVCYLVAHTVASAALFLLSLKWLLRVDPALRALRTGLASLMLGGLLDIGYSIAKWAAVGARWSGRDWDGLSTYVAPPLASGAALLVGAGFIVPMLGGSATWRDFSQYRRLRPLWRALRGFASRSVTTVPLTWWSPMGIRLIHRESVIDDGLLALAGWFDPAVRSGAYGAARGQGLTDEAASVVADAAMLAAACRARTAADAAGTAPARPTGTGPTSDGPGPGACAGPVEPAPYRLDGQPLEALAHAFHTSPIVARARRGEPSPQPASPAGRVP